MTEETNEAAVLMPAKVNLFAVYARIFRLMLATSNESKASEEDMYAKELDNLVLPSNEEWRLKVYYGLVDQQRKLDANLPKTPDQAKEKTVSLDSLEEEEWEWEPNLEMPFPLKTEASQQVNQKWESKDFLLAAKLLGREDRNVEYADELEMRRVISLVYDVLRYRHVFEKILDETEFWRENKELYRRQRLVWMLFYEMQMTNFSHSETRSEIVKESDGLRKIEQALMRRKSQLTTNLSRLLEKAGSSATLEDLLPVQLRRPKLNISSAWINGTIIAHKEDFVEEMKKLGLRLSVDAKSGHLAENEYSFDPLCPKTINLHDRAAEVLALSELAQRQGVFFLNRSICLGAAVIFRAIRWGKLCGPVVLTHSVAPRHTAYLAQMLSDIPDMGRLLAFGLGDKLDEYKSYMNALGLIERRRIRLFAEDYSSAPSFPELFRATVVLAMPPCSCTGVRDIVDLAAARGGDVELLEMLSNQHVIMRESKQPRDQLAKQMNTLKHALTRPQVQLLIYEVRSLLPTETKDMLEQTLQVANAMAKDKFVKDNLSSKKRPKRANYSKGKKSQQKELSDDEDSLISPPVELSIPDSDVFEVFKLNDLFARDCTNLFDPGSYVVLVKRKEIMQFNSSFMIKVAEAKGVFGKDPNKSMTVKPVDLIPVEPVTKAPKPKKRCRSLKAILASLRAPTYCFMTRTLRDPTKNECPRHRQHLVRVETVIEKQTRETKRLDAHRWWNDLVKIFRDLNNSSHMYKFQALRTDPRTGKFLFPVHLLVVSSTETLQVISETKSLEAKEGKVIKKRRRKKFSKRRSKSKF